LFFVATAVACTVAAVGCDGDETEPNTTGSNTTTTSSGSAGGGGTGGGSGVMVPQLGAQIERMGRPAINTALNHAFDGDMMTKDAAKDAWNTAARQDWAGFSAEVADNLGILDSLDTVCGNQFLAAPDPVMPDRYDALATVLTDDRLWVKLDGMTCAAYLGVEVGMDDCGGRRLSDDVIDISYTVLATGGMPVVGDTIGPDPVKTAAEAFPYLSDPQ
jgi:hypothetical protein